MASNETHTALGALDENAGVPQRTAASANVLRYARDGDPPLRAPALTGACPKFSESGRLTPAPLMPLRRFLNFLRLLFLGVCIAAIGARVVWTEYPDQVQRADDWIVRNVGHKVRRELTRATKAEKAGDPEAALRHYLKVVEDTEGTKRGDRLEEVRAPSLIALRDHHYGEGRLEEALAWADKLHELDERNLANELSRAKLLGALGKTDESIALFAWLNDLTQGISQYETAYFNQLVQSERGPEAVELLVRMQSASGLELPLKGWEMRYRLPESPKTNVTGFDLEGEEAGGGITARGGVALGVPADAIQEVRIDAPRGASLLAKQVRLIVSLSDGQEATLGLKDVTRLNQLVEVDGGIRGNAKSDPFMVMALPEISGDVDITEITLELDLAPVFPQHINDFLESDLGARSLQEVAADYEAGGGTDADRARLLELQEILNG